MTFGHFIWNDLSTYNVKLAKKDYGKLFGWKFKNIGSYHFARVNGKEVAGLFLMPDRLARINMPSFWMSYIHVADLDKVVAKAKRHDDVIVEVEPQTFNKSSRIALVRDPSGAGFTLYEGPDISPSSGEIGTVKQRFHHVHDLEVIKPFYTDLFGWEFRKCTEAPWPCYEIFHKDGTCVGIVEEVPQNIRGKFRYWMPCFAVHSMSDTLARLTAIKGEVDCELTGGRLIARDRQGGYFMVCG